MYRVRFGDFGMAVPQAGDGRATAAIEIFFAIGVPSAGVALILGVDRILDMVRTATNVTGDCTVTVFVDASEKRAEESA